MKIMNMFAPEGSKGVTTECLACKLHFRCRNPHLSYVGKGKMEVLIIGDMPSKSEDKSGRLLTGSSASFLEDCLSDFGLRLKEDFWYTTVLQCRVRNGKEPSDKQVKCCYDNLIETIKELRPRQIWTVGNVATKAVIGYGLKKVSITSLSGRKVPWHDFDCWVIPMLDHGMISRRSKDKNTTSYYLRQLKEAIRFSREDPELPKLNPYKDTDYLYDPDEIVAAIEKVRSEQSESSFDFETSGLDPWWPGHIITSMAISTDDRTYAFPIEHPEANFSDEELDRIEDAIAGYFEDDSLIRIGHRVNFDLQWAEFLIRAVPKGKFYCTLTTGHIVDHRPGNLSLKDLAFLKWGIANYDDSTKPYIECVPGTHFNRMHRMPLKDQLLYVGADARITLKLFRDQQSELSSAQFRANEFFTDMLVPLRDISNNGICIDTEWYAKKSDELDKEISSLEYELNNNKDAERYERIYKTPFQYTSPKCLKELFFDIYKLPSVGTTEAGNDAVDEKALLKIDFWMCEKILKVRKLVKLRDTYIKQYIRNECMGVVHPDFRLDTSRSFRSSCLDPNVQNTPKRNPESKKIIRKGMVPPKKKKIFELDYSGMEVSTSAMYHKDPTFINYLITPGTDMHRDNACDIWCAKPEDIEKMVRFYIKNMWTFPQFYGDYFGSCAPQLWETCIEELDLKLNSGISLIENLEDHGITSLKQFTKHCEEAEYKMWNERFPVYTAWKKEINDFYIKHGFVETYLGFRFTGMLDRKQTANYPIQGTAFHLLLWALHQVNDHLKRNKWETYLVAEIHDSMIGYTTDDEQPELVKLVKKICTEDIRERFDFINVPLGIEIEVSEVDGNFSELKTIAV